MIKAACHIHSEWSYDGQWPLTKIAGEFGRRGYHVLLTTEHDRGFSQARLLEYREACAKASSERILIVPGIEYSDADNVVHILVWGSIPFLGEALPTVELLDKVKAAGGFAVLAHPSRKEAWKRFDPRWASNLLGIEIWNRKTDGWAPSNTAMPLMRATSLLPFVGLDFHSSRQFFPLAVHIDLRTPVSEVSVMDGLTHRRCHSTVFGQPFEQQGLNGWRLVGLHAAERCRRSVAATRRLFAKG